MQLYHTFISYSRTDGEFALKLANDLRTNGVNIWLDQIDIPPGARWDRAVENALETSGRILVVLSPTSSASENVQDEIGLAFDNQKPIMLFRGGSGTESTEEAGEPTATGESQATAEELQMAESFSCDQENQMQSPASQNAVDIVVTNHRDEAVSLYWINDQGERVHYLDLDAGATKSQPTYEGHIWLVTDQTGNCIGLYKAPGAIVIE